MLHEAPNQIQELCTYMRGSQLDMSAEPNVLPLVSTSSLQLTLKMLPLPVQHYFRTLAFGRTSSWHSLSHAQTLKLLS